MKNWNHVLNFPCQGVWADALLPLWKLKTPLKQLNYVSTFCSLTEYVYIQESKQQLSLWNYSWSPSAAVFGSRLLSSFFLPHIHDKWFSALGPGSLTWRIGQLMNLLPGSGWEHKPLPSPLLKALGFAFNVLSPENRTILSPQPLTCKEGRARGGDMPSKNCHRGHEGERGKESKHLWLPAIFEVLFPSSTFSIGTQ